MPKINFKSDTWTIVEKYLNSNTLIDHQLSSFNYFIKNIVPKITKQYNPIPLSFQPDNGIEF